MEGEKADGEKADGCEGRCGMRALSAEVWPG